jgi:hypothetical protein
MIMEESHVISQSNLRKNQVTSPTMKEKNPNFIRTNNDGPPRNRVKLSSQYLDKAITCVNWQTKLESLLHESWLIAVYVFVDVKPS